MSISKYKFDSIQLQNIGINKNIKSILLLSVAINKIQIIMSNITF